MSCGVWEDTKCVSCVSLLFDFFFKGKLTRTQLSYHGFVFVVQRCDSGLPVRSSSSSAVRSPSSVLPSLRAAAAKHLGLSGPGRRRRRRRRRRPGVRGWEEELEIASGGVLPTFFFTPPSLLRGRRRAFSNPGPSTMDGHSWGPLFRPFAKAMTL